MHNKVQIFVSGANCGTLFLKLLIFLSFLYIIYSARAKKIVANTATPQQASPERQVRSRAGVSQSQRK